MQQTSHPSNSNRCVTKPGALEAPGSELVGVVVCNQGRSVPSGRQRWRSPRRPLVELGESAGNRQIGCGVLAVR